MFQRRFALLPEALLIGLLGVLMTTKALNSGLALYIHPRYHLLLAVVGALLTLLGLARLAIGREPIPGRMLLLPALVVLCLVVVPARPLGASLASAKSLNSQSNADLIARLEGSRSNDTSEWTLLEWTAALRSEGVTALQGKPVRFEGFVFRTDDLPAEAVFVGRYLVTCCTADGRALALAVRTATPAAFATDQWVRVEGTLNVAEIDGEMVPMVDGTLTPIDPPKVPYLYP